VKQHEADPNGPRPGGLRPSGPVLGSSTARAR
jgi:hypothetical protein